MIVTEDQIREEITDAIRRNRIMLFMKGTPDMPRCGFSMRTVQCLDAAGADYAAMDILPDPRIRQQLSAQSGWPTIPQLFIDGELVGGCDIVTELHQSGELAKMVAPAA
jgi:monothiol glutaredoxin